MRSDHTRLRFVIVGAGSIGERHARVFGQLGVETNLVDLRIQRAREVADRCGSTSFYATLDEVPLHACHAAVICTPADSHVPIAQRCADAGLHLLIEKPLAASLDGIDRLLATCRAASSVLGIAYVLRHHPTVVRARELLLQHVLGDIVSVQAVCSHNVAVARPNYRSTYFAAATMGGGVILDLSHELNYIEWLVGPLRLTACRAAVVPSLEVQTEGIADILLETESRAPVNIHLHAGDWNDRREFEIVGARATLHADLVNGDLALHRASATDKWSDDVAERDIIYRLQAESFLRCIREGETPRCTGNQALQTLRTCLDARARAVHHPLEARRTARQ